MRLNIKFDVFKSVISCDFIELSEFIESNTVAETECSDKFNPRILFNTLEPISITVVAHELIHAIRHDIGYKRGQPNLDKWDDEVLPYMVQYGMKEIIKFCEKKDIKISNY